MNLHYEKIGKHKKGSRYDKDMLRVLPRDHSWLTDIMVVKLTPQDITNYRNLRLEKVKPATVRRELGYISSVLTYAVRELYIIKSNPCNDMTKPEQGKSRYRRISDDEIAQILQVADYQIGNEPISTKHYVAWSFVWAIESAMRRNEILGMTWDNIHTNHVHLPTSKTDESRDVPLSPTMRILLDSLPDSDDECLIPVLTETFKTAWGRILKKTDIEDLTFRDTRHEAISRMVNKTKIPVEQLAKITGHKKIDTLVNVYYNPTADELHNALYG